MCAALLCAVAFTPAAATAAGECEYCVDIPGGDGNGQDPTANASGGSGGSGGSTDSGPSDTTPSAPSTETAPESDSSDGDGDGGSGAAGGNDNGKGGGAGGGQDEPAARSGDRPQELAPVDETAATPASDSDDGGFPVILVAIAVLAAAGAGFAAWRLRRGDGVGRPAGHSA